jgi:hypothetical protein
MVDGKDNQAKDTADDKQQNRPAQVDVYIAAQQHEDQADGEESQQTTAAAFDERRAFTIAHGSPKVAERWGFYAPPVKARPSAVGLWAENAA